MSDDEYYARVAVHGDLSDEDVPGTLLTTDEEDAVIEILYLREEDGYWTCSRHIGNGVLHVIYGQTAGIEDAMILAIDAAREEGLPILKRVYTYGPENGTDDELGSDRIPAPWDDDDDET